MSDTNDAADVAATEPEATPAPEPTPEPTAGPGSPWSNDLEAAFADDTIRSEVDKFLRDQVQPYVTRLEQESQPDRNAQRLWNDFGEDPNGTFTAVARELYGDDKTADILEVLTGATNKEDGTVDQQLDNATDPLITPDDLPEDVREAVEYVQNQRQNAAFDQALSDLREDNPDVEIDDDLFYPFVTAAEGNLDNALAAYQAWQAKAKETWGINVPEVDEVDVPPPTISPDRQTPSAPPVEEKHVTLDDAMDAFFAEKNAPPAIN